tara:strand:- start:220 stop:1152 length:933 start_codon:yes stop_codon:yes gene_type:complete
MIIKIDFRNFWSNFKQQAKNQGGLKRSFIQVLSEDGYEFQLDENDPDIIFFNSFGPITYEGNAIKIGYVTESANRFTSIFDKIKEKYFDLVIGNVPNIKSKFLKHPLYIPSCDPYTINQQYFNNLNEYVKDRDIKDLKFCALVNSHDQFNTRTPILRELEKLSFVECPGKLHHNTPSFDDEGISKIDYLKKFIFNICPENTVGHEGYYTEKLMDCSISGCIPLYYGQKFDEHDKKIFNEERIIFFDPYDNDSVQEAALKVKNLLENQDLLEKMYKMPIFLETAENTLRILYDNLKVNFSKMIKKKFKKNK